MILKTLNFLTKYSQILTNTLLEKNKEFNILFIQEPPWSIICNILSLISKEGKKIVSISNHPF